MIKYLSKFLLICFLVIYLPVKSNAWGALGHRIVGEIASGYLTSKANKEIKKILGNETVALASTWADFIKSDTNYRYLNDWHYIDFKKGTSAGEIPAEVSKDTSANAYSRLNWLIDQLKNDKTSLKDKQMYLRLVIHIVGDLHQPFHVSAEGDRGGNDIRVTWFNEPSNIHRVWDEHLIEYQQLSYTEFTKAINFTTPAQRTQWQSSSPADWLAESFVISEKLHAELKPNQKLGYSYNFEHVNTLNEQLLKGGVRLAGLLNQIFS